MSGHVPVLLDACVDALVRNNNGVYVDVTFGAGGHSRAILNRLAANGQLMAFDQDVNALGNTLDDPRFLLLHSNFRFFDRFLDHMGHPQVDGILADLGVSSMQLDIDQRGFSHRFEGTLDMRMDDHGLSAADVLNTYDAATLQAVFSRYGEVRNARSLALAVVEARRIKPFAIVQELLDLVDLKSIGQEHRYRSQVFQALRIEVNDEMGALASFLTKAIHRLKPGGRLVILTYHSLEDRMVKRFMKSGNADGELVKDDFGMIIRPLNLVNKKPILPTKDEIEQNKRARSAKLRVAERI